MGDNQNWNSTGEQIKGALAEALKSGDFRNLNALVSQTATSVLNEVGIHIPSDGEDDVSRMPPPAWRQAETGKAQQTAAGRAGSGGAQQTWWRQAGTGTGQQTAESQAGSGGARQTWGNQGGTGTGQPSWGSQGAPGAGTERQEPGSPGAGMSQPPFWQSAQLQEKSQGGRPAAWPFAKPQAGQPGSTGTAWKPLPPSGRPGKAPAAAPMWKPSQGEQPGGPFQGPAGKPAQGQGAPAQTAAWPLTKQESQTTAWQQTKPQDGQTEPSSVWQQPGGKPKGAAWQQAKPPGGQPGEETVSGPAQAWQQVKRQAQQAGTQAQQTWQQVKTQARPIWQPGAQQTWQNRQRPIVHPAWQNRQQNLPEVRPGADLSFVNMKKVGNVSGVLYQVFGGIGLGITGFVTFVRLIALASGETTVRGWIVNLIFLAIFFGMVRLGIGQKRRLRRARRYVALCDNRMFGEVSDLAKNTGKSEAYVAKDLGKMLDVGIFPEGHLDDQKTCFMLNDTVYRQYLRAEDGRRQREEAEQKTAESVERAQSPGAGEAQDGIQDAELDTMIAEGMECIRRLRNLNDRISGDGISGRLFCLENLLKDIFDSIREHPEQMHRMHKLMDYYLPTTLKLVEAYAGFDQVSAPGEEIAGAKAEIENTLDIINQAFTELLNNLFQDAVFDATTDAQVLKTMLAREGLTREMEFAGVSRER